MEKSKIKTQIAAIDIGTNSCRLLIAQLENKKIKNKILKLMDITNLGEDTDKTNKLKTEAISRTVDVLKKYKNVIDEYKIKKIKIFATSATRDAKNRDEFINRIKKETNFNIQCISGEKEGELSFRGVISEFDRKILVVDIGGGSTEFILGDGKNIEFIKSINVGSVRLSEKNFWNEKKILESKLWVNKLLSPILPILNSNRISNNEHKSFKLVGVAGTITTHVSILLKMSEYDCKKIHMYLLTRDGIIKNLNMLLETSVENRKNILGLHPKRSATIIPGTYILLWIMKMLNRDEITVSESDILEGMILDE